MNEYISAKLFGMKGKYHCGNNFQVLEKISVILNTLSNKNSEIQ